MQQLILDQQILKQLILDQLDLKALILDQLILKQLSTFREEWKLGQLIRGTHHSWPEEGLERDED